MNYIYNVANHRVIDGDTVDVDIDLGFDCWLHKQRIRLYGIDAPETRTRDLNDKAKGMEAKAFVIEIFENYKVRLVSNEFAKGKFGRILGTFEYWQPEGLCWTDLNLRMVSLGLAKTYFGGKR